MNSSQKDLALYRMEKAKQTLSAARDMFSHRHFDTVVNRAYYANFTAMRALLAFKQDDSKTHAGVFAKFNLYFIRENLLSKDFNKLLNEAKTVRERADYGDFFEVDEETAKKHIAAAELFLSKSEELLNKLLLDIK